MLNLTATLTAIKNAVQHKPIELTDIYLGSQTAEDDNTLHFVNYYKSVSFFQYISHETQSYTPLSISRSAVKKSTQLEIDRVTYKVDNVNSAMASYAASYNFRNKRIVTRLIFRDYLTSYLDAKIVFDGFIQAIVFEEKSMSATCVPILGSLNFETGWLYQINCNAKFGDAYCKIDKTSSANMVTGAATSGGSKTVLIDTINITRADNYWRFGTVEFTSGDNNGELRAIISSNQSANSVTLDYPLNNNIAVNDEYVLYRGCDKTLNTCANYSNTVNYHGFHTIPLTK